MATLILEDGTRFEGTLFGHEAAACGEVVFTTGMCGYQQTLTDPAYRGQIVCMTYPLIGNVGVNDLDFESSDGWVMGITAVHGGSMMTEDAGADTVTLARGAEATASIGWRGTAGADMVRVGTLLVAPYAGTLRQELEADIDLAEPGFLTVTAWTPAGGEASAG